MCLISCKKHNRITKLISLVVTALFIVTTLDIPVSLTYASQANAIWTSSDSFDGIRSVSELYSLKVPEALGQVTDSFYGSSGKAIILLQDLHCNFFAQQNIDRILEQLHTGQLSQLFSCIAVEGAKGPVDTSLISSIPEGQVKDELVKILVSQGLISGSECFAGCQGGDVEIYGVENKSIYFENVDYFQESMSYKKTVSATLLDLEMGLQNIGKQVFSEKLQEIYETIYVAHNKQSILYSLYQEKSADLEVDLSSFTNFQQMLKSLKYEDGFDLEQMYAERKNMIEALQKKLVREEAQKLVLMSLRFRTGRVSSASFYRYLQSLMKENSIDETEYPQLSRYIAIVDVHESIDNRMLVKEISEIESLMKEALFINDDERQIDHLLKNVQVCRHLFNLDLSRDDYAYFQKHRDEFRSDAFKESMTKFFQAGFSLDVSVSSLYEKLMDIDTHIGTAEDFYKALIERDYVLIRNTLSHMKRKDLELAVLVSGGFHTDGITEELRERGVSYFVVLPNGDTYQGDALYHDMIMRTKTALDMLLNQLGQRLAPLIRLHNDMSESGEELDLAKVIFLLYSILSLQADDVTGIDVIIKRLEKIDGLPDEIKENLEAYFTEDAEGIIKINLSQLTGKSLEDLPEMLSIAEIYDYFFRNVPGGKGRSDVIGIAAETGELKLQKERERQLKAWRQGDLFPSLLPGARLFQAMSTLWGKLKAFLPRMTVLLVLSFPALLFGCMVQEMGTGTGLEELYAERDASAQIYDYFDFSEDDFSSIEMNSLFSLEGEANVVLNRVDGGTQFIGSVESGNPFAKVNIMNFFNGGDEHPDLIDLSGYATIYLRVVTDGQFNVLPIRIFSGRPGEPDYEESLVLAERVPESCWMAISIADLREAGIDPTRIFTITIEVNGAGRYEDDFWVTVDDHLYIDEGYRKNITDTEVEKFSNKDLAFIKEYADLGTEEKIKAMDGTESPCRVIEVSEDEDFPALKRSSGALHVIVGDMPYIFVYKHLNDRNTAVLHEKHEIAAKRMLRELLAQDGDSGEGIAREIQIRAEIVSGRKNISLDQAVSLLSHILASGRDVIANEWTHVLSSPFMIMQLAKMTPAELAAQKMDRTYHDALRRKFLGQVLTTDELNQITLYEATIQDLIDTLTSKRTLEITNRELIMSMAKRTAPEDGAPFNQFARRLFLGVERDAPVETQLRKIKNSADLNGFLDNFDEAILERVFRQYLYCFLNNTVDLSDADTIRNGAFLSLFEQLISGDTEDLKEKRNAALLLVRFISLLRNEDVLNENVLSLEQAQKMLYDETVKNIVTLQNTEPTPVVVDIATMSKEKPYTWQPLLNGLAKTPNVPVVLINHEDSDDARKELEQWRELFADSGSIGERLVSATVTDEKQAEEIIREVIAKALKKIGAGPEMISDEDIVMLVDPAHQAFYAGFTGAMFALLAKPSAKILTEQDKQLLLNAGVSEKDLGTIVELLDEVIVGTQRATELMKVSEETRKKG